MEPNIELAKLEVEKVRIECELKNTDLELKRAELVSKLDNKTQKSLISSPLAIAIITGLLGLVGVGIANYLQTAANLSLEQEKAESALILKAIETGDQQVAAKNLTFLVHIGLIRDKTGRIGALENSPLNAPVLPRQNSAVSSKEHCGVWQSVNSGKQYTFVCRDERQFDVYENDSTGPFVKIGSGEFKQGIVEAEVVTRKENRPAHLSLQLSQDGKGLEGTLRGLDPRENFPISFRKIGGE